MRILCYDASGSTMYASNYWNSVEQLSKSTKFDALLSWSSECERVDRVKKPQWPAGTEPCTFMEYILINFDKDYVSRKYGKDAELILDITTDGQIDDYQIQLCAALLTLRQWTRLGQVTVHYIGDESDMNFGLNAVFGSVSNLRYSINNINALQYVISIEELENYEDIFAPEFLTFLCSRVTYLKTNDFEAFDRLRKNLIAKIERKHKEANEPISPKKYFEKDDAVGLENAIKDRLFSTDQTDYQLQKNKILACFDRCADIKLSDVRARGDLKTNVLTEKDVVAGYELCEDIVVEDSISFEAIDQGKVCILVKFDQPAIFKCDSKYVKNPLLIFQDEATRTKMIKRFELHPFSIESVRKLAKGNDIMSPFTRDNCRAFILGPANMNEINFNSRALASFFKCDQRNKIFGNKLLWNLVILYLIKTHIDSTVKNDEGVAWPRDELHPLVNAVLKEYILNDVLLYHLTLHISINLPVKRVPLYVALWYIIRVAPYCASNSTRNILRYPGASILLNLYEDLNLEDKIPLDSKLRKKLHFRVKVWRLWNEMLARRKDKELKLTTRAAYQNYCVVEDKIVLLSGARPKDLPAPDLVDGIPPSVVQNMWSSLNPKSKRFDKINEDGHSLPSPKPVVLRDDSKEFVEVYHMKIDPKTLRPTEICPVTNRPAVECAGEFDVKSESYARMFSLYCAKYKKYPEKYEQLVLLHNRKRAVDNVSSRHVLKYLNHVFEVYKPVVKDMPCNEFVDKYNAYGENKPKESPKPESRKKRKRSSKSRHQSRSRPSGSRKQDQSRDGRKPESNDGRYESRPGTSRQQYEFTNSRKRPASNWNSSWKPKSSNGRRQMFKKARRH